MSQVAAGLCGHRCTPHRPPYIVRLHCACPCPAAHGGARCRQDLWAAGGFEALLTLLKEEAHQVAVLDALAAWLEQVRCLSWYRCAGVWVLIVKQEASQVAMLGHWRPGWSRCAGRACIQHGWTRVQGCKPTGVSRDSSHCKCCAAMVCPGCRQTAPHTHVVQRPRLCRSRRGWKRSLQSRRHWRGWSPCCLQGPPPPRPRQVGADGILLLPPLLFCCGHPCCWCCRRYMKAPPAHLAGWHVHRRQLSMMCCRRAARWRGCTVQ